MTEIKKNSPALIIAGILFALLAASRLLSMFSFITEHLRYGLIPDTNILLRIIILSYGFPLAAYAAAAVGLIVGGCMDRRRGSAKLPPLIGLGLLVLMRLVSFVAGFWGTGYAARDYVYLRYEFHPLCVLPALVSLAGFIALFVFAAICPADRSRQGGAGIRILWFVPGLCIVLSHLADFVVAFILRRFGLIWDAGMFTFYGIPTIINLFSEALFIAAFLLAGLGFTAPAAQSIRKAQPYTGPYQAGVGAANSRYNVPGPVPGSGYVPGPGPVPGSGYIPGPGPVSGSGYAPGPGPVSGPGYIPGPGPVPGPGYTPESGPAPGPAYDPSRTGAGVVEELKQYKELLDSGVITEEEFSAKKKQLLGL